MVDEREIDSAAARPQPSPGSDTSSMLRDRRVRPEGVVPKQAQAYVIAGLAVLILLAVLFSKNQTRAVSKEGTPSLALPAGANPQKLEELERDLASDERRSGLDTLHAPTATTQPSSSFARAHAAAPSETPRDPIADAERDLAFKARFASNLVATASEPRATIGAVPAEARAAQASAPSARPVLPADSPRAVEVNLNRADGQPYVVFEGTTFDTVLVNRLDAEFAGPVKVMVTHAVYSQDRQHTLVPEGSFLLGEAAKVAGLGQRRLAVTFHRMLMPDGYSVDLDRFPGLDQAGASGLKDKVNNHYAEIFGASIALGVIAGAAEATTLNAGFNETGGEAYKAGIAASLSQSGANVLDRFINVLPTLTLREGHRVKVYLTEDLLLPAYENHRMPGQF